MGKRRILTVLLFLLGLGTSQLFAEFSFPYNENLSLVSDFTSVLTMATPTVLAFEAAPSDYLAIGASYSATMLSSYIVRSTLKSTINRERPYVGESIRPADTSEDYESFPSGHTLLAFASATYLQTMTSMRYPDSNLLKTTSIVAWSLAATTAVLRVVSGNHYPTDVLGGAAIGGALGFVGSYVTCKLLEKDSKAPQMLIGPTIGMHVSL